MNETGNKQVSEIASSRISELFKINLFGFALNALWNPMSTHLMPLIILGVVAETQKNTYLGIVTFAGIILAMIVQPLAGAISDRSTFRWGRRLPYIFIGSIASIVFLLILGRVDNVLAVLLIYCLLQISSNTAHGPWQGLIPDTVPENRLGLASGIKSLLEILGAIIGIQLAGYLVSERFKAPEDIKIFLALLALSIIIAVAMIATVLLVKERKITAQPSALLTVLRNTFRISIKKDASFIYFLISRFLFLLPLLVLRTFGFYFFKDITEFTDPSKVIADLTTVIGICLLLIVYPAGYLADRIGRKPIVMIAGITGSLGVLIMIFLHSYIWIMIAGALIGIANGSFMSANWAIATNLVKKGDEARYLGLTNLATGGAAAIAAIAGPLIDLLNKYTANLGYQIILGICVLLLVISSVIVLKIKLPRH